MNKEPRNSNVPGLLLLVLFALALVAACSGVDLPPGSIPPLPSSSHAGPR